MIKYWQEEPWRDDFKHPTPKEIQKQDNFLLQQQRNFQLAAELIASAWGRFPQVEQVVLFGSVAKPLKKEAPRFKQFRRAGIEVWHECKDVDLAVWLNDLDCLNLLRKELSRTLNRLFQNEGIGVAHHQVDVFIIEPETNCHLGNLCIFNTCPKGKIECRVENCGQTPFLRLNEDFSMNPEALAPDKVVVLYEKQTHNSQ